VLRDAVPRVLDRKDHLPRRARAVEQRNRARADARRVPGACKVLDGDVAAASELGGVADKVEQHVDEPVGVGDHVERVGGGGAARIGTGWRAHFALGLHACVAEPLDQLGQQWQDAALHHAAHVDGYQLGRREVGTLPRQGDIVEDGLAQLADGVQRDIDGVEGLDRERPVGVRLETVGGQEQRL